MSPPRILARRRAWLSALARASGLCTLLLGLFSGSSFAYPTMIRHEYASCAQCHADPSGGSLLTAYGRGQGEILLRSRYGKNPDEEPGPVAEFLFGAVSPPEGLLLGGDFRLMTLATQTSGSGWTPRVFPMQGDVVGQYTAGRLRVNASIGLGNGLATQAASLTQGNIRLISRHHWVGVDLGEDNQFLLRFGRMNLPYGLRTTDHTTYVRSSTHTDINDQQQHGFALAYGNESLRAEVMAILGNLQVSPPAFRERGYSAYIEWAAAHKVALGLSSLITHTEQDLGLLVPKFRQSHGFFARAALGRLLVISAEGNFLFESPKDNPWKMGASALLQLDFEPVQGLHVAPMGELMCSDFRSKSPCQIAVWGTASWFVAPHTDLRFDFIHERWTDSTPPSNKLLFQVHFFL